MTNSSILIYECSFYVKINRLTSFFLHLSVCVQLRARIVLGLCVLVLEHLLLVLLLFARLSTSRRSAEALLVGSSRFGGIFAIAIELERFELKLPISGICRSGNAISAFVVLESEAGVDLVVVDVDVVGGHLREFGMDRATSSGATATKLRFAASLEHLLGDLFAGVLLKKNI